MSGAATADSSYYSRNNFDLMRLVAAAQVFAYHAIDFLQVKALLWLLPFISAFPGVPAFFFVSGFLITAAWERNPDASIFYHNRFYRIFPGLWTCVLVTAVSLVLLYDARMIAVHAAEFFAWLVGQSTFVQVWTPTFLRGYGVGVVNGVLWTIPVELFFYACVPLLYSAYRRLPVGRSTVLAAIAAASLASNYAVYAMPPDPDTALLKKFVSIRPLPWLGMFCLGALAQQHIGSLYRVVAGKAPAFLALFAGVSVVPFHYEWNPLFGFGNHMGFVNYIAMCLLVLSCAYTRRGVSDRILRRNDYSYGLYIYHMPVINAFVQRGWSGTAAFASALACVAAFAATSWWLVEKRSLRRRKKKLYER